MKFTTYFIYVSIAFFFFGRKKYISKQWRRGIQRECMQCRPCLFRRGIPGAPSGAGSVAFLWDDFFIQELELESPSLGSAWTRTRVNPKWVWVQPPLREILLTQFTWWVNLFRLSRRPSIPWLNPPMGWGNVPCVWLTDLWRISQKSWLVTIVPVAPVCRPTLK